MIAFPRPKFKKVRPLPLSNGWIALVDTEDYEYLAAMSPWHVDENEQVYTVQPTPSGPPQRLYLAHVTFVLHRCSIIEKEE